MKRILALVFGFTAIAGCAHTEPLGDSAPGDEENTEGAQSAIGPSDGVPTANEAATTPASTLPTQDSLTASDPTAAAGGDAGASTEVGVPTFTSIPNPALIVANGGAGTVSIIDPATLTVVSSVSVMTGMHPHHIGISPDKSRLLVTATSADLSLGHGAGAHGGGHDASGASTKIYLLDVATRQLRDIITVEATAHNAAFTSDGATIVFGMMEHGMIAAHDATTFAEVFGASGFDMPLEVTPSHSGSLLVAESGAGRVALFDLASRTISTTFAVGATPVAAWATGGTNYFVAAEEGMQLNHLVEDSGSVTMDSHTIMLDGMPGQAALTPDGSELWVALEDMGMIEILDANTHEKLAEVVAGTKPHGVAFDADGSRAFVTDETGGKLLTIDVSERSVSSELVLGGNPNGIVWLQN